jgi:hypothetical protein
MLDLLDRDACQFKWRDFRRRVIAFVGIIINAVVRLELDDHIP